MCQNLSREICQSECRSESGWLRSGPLGAHTSPSPPRTPTRAKTTTSARTHTHMQLHTQNNHQYAHAKQIGAHAGMSATTAPDYADRRPMGCPYAPLAPPNSNTGNTHAFRVYSYEKSKKKMREKRKSEKCAKI